MRFGFAFFAYVLLHLSLHTHMTARGLTWLAVVRKSFVRRFPGKRKAGVAVAALFCGHFFLLWFIFSLRQGHKSQPAISPNSFWPAPLSCPWLSQNVTSTRPDFDQGHSPVGTLVTYAVLDSTQRSLAAFSYFVEVGLRDESAVFHFLFAGVACRTVATRLAPSLCFEHACSTLNGASVDIVEDWVGRTSSSFKGQLYGHYLFLSTNVGGPFLPKYVNPSSWTERISSLLVGGPKLLVPTLFCSVEAPHILTVSSRSLIAMDSEVFMLCSENGFFRGDTSVGRLLVSLLQRGFLFRVLDPGFTFSTWTRTRNHLCEPQSSSQLHPYDIMFTPEYPPELLNKRPHLHAPPMPYRHKTVHKTLIVYVYFEKDQECIENLMYFLRVGVSQHAHVSYLFVVNGKSTVSFPKFANVEVVVRSNTCFDIGTWGLFVQQRKREYAHFVVINTSLRGPFLPYYWDTSVHWSSAFTQFLSNKTKLVGISVNCPDGVGRKYVHIQSMILAFDVSTMELWSSYDILRCAPDMKSAYYQESDLTRILLENGYSIEVMQVHLHVSDWERYHQMHKNGKLLRRKGFDYCENVDLDIFYKPNWYEGSTPHPSEFVFLKTNRGIFKELPTYPKVLPPFSTIPSDIRSFLLFTHYLEADGAPLYLFDFAQILQSLGFVVRVVSPVDGPLRSTYEAAGITVDVLKLPNSWNELQLDTCTIWMQTVLQFLYKANWVPDVMIFNTILWFPFLQFRRELSLAVSVIWAIHEAELDADNAQYEFSYSSLFPDMHNPRVWSSADLVLFSSSSVRSAVSMHDSGNFATFYFYGTDLTMRGLQYSKAALRRKRNIPSDALVVTSVGTITQRKRQDWTVRSFVAFMQARPKISARLLLIGWPLREDDYAKFVRGLVPSRMSKYVLFIPRSDRVATLLEVAMADLHVSASSHESFPLNTLEAMMIGVPVLATPAYGVVEQILNDDVGFLVPQRDNFTAYASLFSKALSDPSRLREVGRRSKRFFDERFSVQKSANNVAKLLQRLRPEVRLALPVFDNMTAFNICVVLVIPNGLHELRARSVERAIGSIVNQTHINWELIIASWKRVHFAVHKVIASFDDNRIRFSGHASSSSSATMIDSSILQCKANTDWLLITNMDSLYHPTFLESLLARTAGQDIICDSHSHHRLEATLLNFHRYQCEGHRFMDGDLSPTELLYRLVNLGWVVSNPSAMV